MKYLVCILFGLGAIAASAQSAPAPVKPLNVLFITPLVASANGGIGFGLQYECGLPKDRKTTFVLPFSVCFSDVTSSNPAPGGGSTSQVEHKPAVYMLSPGLRYYPRGRGRGVKYCLGASLFIGWGKGVSYESDGLQDRSIFGVAFANAVNFQFGHFRMSIEADLGLGSDDGFGHSSRSSANANNSTTAPIARLACAVGYRF